MLDDSEAGEALARVCVGKLSGFLEDQDQNRESRFRLVSFLRGRKLSRRDFGSVF